MLRFDEIGTMYEDALASLHAACFDMPWDKKAFHSLLLLPTTRGFINEKAFILCSVCADEAEVLTIGVLPKERGQGIGFDILSLMMSYLKKIGVQSLFLEVNENNLSALGLYKKVGFEQVGRRPNYYPSGCGAEDALILKKKL